MCGYLYVFLILQCCLYQCFGQQNVLSTDVVVVPDEMKNIYRPCPNMEIYCLRKYFSKHAECRPGRGPVPEPYYRAQANFFVPVVDLSVTQTGVQYTGLNGDVSEFYVNPDTDLTVLSINFTNVEVKSTLDYFRYHRFGKAPAVTKSNTTARNLNFTTTTVFRGNRHLDLSHSETTDFLNALPDAQFNPTAGEHPDPEVRQRYKEFLARQRTVLLESALTDAPFYAATYIQHVICDFGLRIL